MTSTLPATFAHWPNPATVTTHLGPLEYHEFGNGPVILFVHLVLADASHWDRMPPLLADRFRCLLPTLPMGAHRLPARPGADLSVAGLARALAELLEQLDLTDVTVVGNDSGGAISQVLAANHPGRLGRVVLTNCDMYDCFPPPIFSYFKLLPYLPGALPVLGRVLKIRALWGLPFVFGLLTREVDGEKIDRWADALLASADVRRDAREVMKRFGPAVTNAAAEVLRTTTLPFLVAWGRDDRAFRPALAERFCREIPTAQLVLLEDCKTLVCWDQPERLAQLIGEFIPVGS